MSGAFDAFTPDESGSPAEDPPPREYERGFRDAEPAHRQKAFRAGHVDFSDICLEDLQVVAGAVDRWRSLRPPFVGAHSISR